MFEKPGTLLDADDVGTEPVLIGTVALGPDPEGGRTPVPGRSLLKGGRGAVPDAAVALDVWRVPVLGPFELVKLGRLLVGLTSDG